MRTIKLGPNDGPPRELSVEVAKQALTIRDMLDATDYLDNDDNGESVPLPNVSSRALDKVIEYLEYHASDPIDARLDRDSDEDSDDENSVAADRRRTDDISEWDKNYMAMDRELMFEVIVAANYLNIAGLLEVGCKTAANQIKGKSAEEVRRLWAIECDLSKEEDERLRAENEWTEEN